MYPRSSMTPRNGSARPFRRMRIVPTWSLFCVILATCWKLTCSLKPVSVFRGFHMYWPKYPAPGPRGKNRNTATAAPRA